MRRTTVPRADDKSALVLSVTFGRIVVLVGVLAALTFIISVAVLTTQATTAMKEQSNQYAATIAEPLPVGVTRHITIKVAHDRVQSGLPISVNQGDHVVIDFDIGLQREADFQIVGYLQSTTVEKGSKPTFEFDADKVGIFTVQLVRREPWEGKTMKKPVGYMFVH